MYLEDALILIAKSALPLKEKQDLIKIFLAVGKGYLTLLKDKSPIPNEFDVTLKNHIRQTETLSALGIITEPHLRNSADDTVLVHFPSSLLESHSLDLINVLNQYVPSEPPKLEESEETDLKSEKQTKKFQYMPRNKYAQRNYTQNRGRK